MNLTARKSGKSYWQQIMMERALSEGKRLLVIDKDGAMIVRRDGNRTIRKRVK